MKVALVGAELEENLGLRYMVSMLEKQGNQAEIVPFNTENDISQVVQKVREFSPQIVGLSMVFTGRAREFCKLAQALREGDYKGHIIAGGHFASLNCERLLSDFPAFDSVALGEGEEIICRLVSSMENLSQIDGLCYRDFDGSIKKNPSTGNPDKLDELPFPKRTTFHSYFDKPIASILSSRGCWRDCAFCSINAWYKQGGGKKFRIRSVDNIVAEMKDLYFKYGIRIYNFQDDNFFLPDPKKAAQRFQAIQDELHKASIYKIAIAVKARPDSIHEESIRVLNEMGLFRVFLGVENASERGLRNLNRVSTIDEILNALRILNNYDVHIAYNLLMFEPDTILDDILINLRFMEKHIENPFNFCRAEAYAGTGLEAKLVAEDRLLGDYFGFDYRLKDPRSEAFHQIANYAFFDRNFSDFGLHYFNMQVDFFFQLLRRFYPELLSQHLRASVRNFIKETNLDTYDCLCQIYDFVEEVNPDEQFAIHTFARAMRKQVDERSQKLYGRGNAILSWINDVFERKNKNVERQNSIALTNASLPFLTTRPVPYCSLEQLDRLDAIVEQEEKAQNGFGFLGVASAPIPFTVFKKQMGDQKN